MDPCVLVIGSGDRHFREYALRGLAAAARVVLVGTSLDWQLPHVADHREVDLDDREAVLGACAELAGRHPVDGVVTWDEMRVALAAEVGERIGVRTMPLAAATACRDKAVQRRRYRDAGVPSARFVLASTAAEARDAAGRIGYPVVVKPPRGSSSTAVQIVRSETALGEAFALAAAVTAPAGAGAAVLVEEFLDGPEISVDSWTVDGRTRSYATAVKRTAFPPFFEEVGHVVGPVLDPQVEAAVHDVVARAHHALGVDRALTHTELVLTADGPRIVELNGRLAGDLIPRVSEMAVPGLSIGALLAAVAAGREPAPLPPPDRLVGIRFLYPGADMTFDDLRVPAALADEPWVLAVQRVSAPGTSLRLPPRQFLGRAGYAIATGASVREVDARLATLAERTAVVGEPLPA